VKSRRHKKTYSILQGGILKYLEPCLNPTPMAGEMLYVFAKRVFGPPRLTPARMNVPRLQAAACPRLTMQHGPANEPASPARQFASPR